MTAAGWRRKHEGQLRRSSETVLALLDRLQGPVGVRERERVLVEIRVETQLAYLAAAALDQEGKQ